MIILISGATHTGKTALAQRLLEKYAYPYVSLDHLKMGLIRSGMTALTPLSDDRDLTALLWPIAREMIKTAIENQQNLIVEGCYIPFDWAKDFEPTYIKEIRYCCLIMSERYIRNHFEDIKRFANVVEHRLDDTAYTMDMLLCDNAAMLDQARTHGVNYIFIEDTYDLEMLQDGFGANPISSNGVVRDNHTQTECEGSH